ncbi:hypothetical protein D3C78_1538170 [compost metagenome]
MNALEPSTKIINRDIGDIDERLKISSKFTRYDRAALEAFILEPGCFCKGAAAKWC